MDNYYLAQTTTDPVILDELSRDKHWWVRWDVAYNLNTSPETLKQMSIGEENNNIKYHIKKHSNCPEETWKYLSALEILKALPTNTQNSNLRRKNP